jgi:hypothetical protein
MVVKIDFHPVSPFIVRIDLLIFHSRQKINVTTFGQEEAEEETRPGLNEIVLDILKDIMI